eukprot:TRINITY_DN7353_c0_g1_i1.p1 TRINITY_DN7353_c0_g1~~TRINITY_DN7353_c0_g1_i1.p1  ORF type:complete len:190 (+),score=58.91 TRINITY_DN7353_c0_g1_i1:933-1502(+)
MNPKYHELEEIPLEEPQIVDALDCIIHSILFQRLLGNVFPVEETLAESTLAIPLTFCKVGQDDQTVRSKVYKGITGFCTALQKLKRDQKIEKVFHLQLRMMNVNTQNVTHEWERWVIPIRIKARASKNEQHQCLFRALNFIVRTTDTAIAESYVPPNDGAHYDFTFHHEVTNPNFMDTVGSLLSYLTYR